MSESDMRENRRIEIEKYKNLYDSVEKQEVL